MLKCPKSHARLLSETFKSGHLISVAAHRTFLRETPLSVARSEEKRDGEEKFSLPSLPPSFLEPTHPVSLEAQFKLFEKAIKNGRVEE